ncbi:MAG TPA: hypothetical protein VNJ29_02120, partial [Candidatus Nitrosotenuis sp.]|nr:hypothetical protein [Candidatus Nitrosotenuis sp.]
MQLLAVLAIVVFAQSIEDPKTTAFRNNLIFQIKKWNARVTTLRESSIQDIKKLSDSEQALYYSLLAKFYFKIDQQQALSDIRQSGNALLSTLQNVDPKSSGFDLRIFSQTLKLIGEVDKQYAQKLISQIAETIENQAHPSNDFKSNLAELYAGLGLVFASDKPETAIKMANLSLRASYADSLPTLLAELNNYNQTLTEKITKQALLKLSNDYSSDALRFESLLGKYILGYLGNANFSNSLQATFLNFHNERLMAAASVVRSQQTRCQIAWYSAVFKADFNRFYPAYSHLYNQNLQKCSYFLPNELQETSRAQPE